MEQSQGVMPNSQEQKQWSDPSLDLFRTPAEGEFDLFDDESPSRGNYLSQAREEVHGVFSTPHLENESRPELEPSELCREIGEIASNLVVARAEMIGGAAARKDLDLAA